VIGALAPANSNPERKSGSDALADIPAVAWIRPVGLPRADAANEARAHHPGLNHFRGPAQEFMADMIAFLILTRATIIAWVTLAVFPFEIAHDAIEAELERQGVEL
jgi:hypothetical protein